MRIRQVYVLETLVVLDDDIAAARQRMRKLTSHLIADAVLNEPLALARFIRERMRSCARHANWHGLSLIMAKGAPRVDFLASRTVLAGLRTALPSSLVASDCLVALVLLLSLLLETPMVSLTLCMGCEYGPMLILLLLLKLNTVRVITLVPFRAAAIVSKEFARYG